MTSVEKVGGVCELTSCDFCPSGCTEPTCPRCYPVAALASILDAIGARVTFDPERSIAKPCIVCGATEQPRELVQIGTFTRRIGGHVPGDPITRPMCAGCEERTR